MNSNHQKKILFALLLLFIGANLLLSQKATPNENNPQLTIHLEPSEIKFTRDSIPKLVNIVLKNTSKEKFRIWRDVNFIPGEFEKGGFRLEIVRKGAADTLRGTAELTVHYRRMPKQRDIRCIWPGHRWKIKRDINSSLNFVVPGTYHVRAVLITRQYFDLNVTEIPPVYSNWITITVTESRQE